MPPTSRKPSDKNKLMRMIRTRLTMAFVTLLTLAACHDDEEPRPATGQTTTYKVAVVMPAAEQVRWHRTAEWALQNLRQAQDALPQRVDLDLEWHDEDAADWESQVERAATDEAYAALIGPKSSVKARRAAQLCRASQRTLVLPVATSTEFQRIYAGSGNVWNLAESDITQCELLLTQAKLAERREVSLLAPDNDYGKSFADWFAFQAAELGLEVKLTCTYADTAELRRRARELGEGRLHYRQAVLFVPGNEEHALAFDDEVATMREEKPMIFTYPLVLCADVMHSSTIIPRLRYSGYEGLAPSASPESGFNSAYEARFGEAPLSGEAHLYDAIVLLSCALTRMEANAPSTLNEAMLDVVDGRTPWRGSWLRDDMRTAYALLRQGETPDLEGVTSDWTFDERTHASVLNTTYAHWVLADGRAEVVEYLSTDGSARTISTVQAWEWQSENLMQFSTTQVDPDYPPLQDRWAVVVGASDDWVNYRHQADALAMYQLLRRHGYDDDHIILVMEDNLAHDPNNLHPGEVRVEPGGENLYHDVQVDYHLSDITFSQFNDLLMGRPLAQGGSVLGSGEHDNVLMFWCGHGSHNSLAWGSFGSVTGADMRALIGGMQEAGKFRKMCFALDACYSGTIGEACLGVPGLVVMTAANPNEPSKADMKDTDMGIWLSNGFTRAFQDAIDTNHQITLRDLYYTCARRTVGSHAMMYNVESNGNVFRNTMGEYLR